jgi:hypothetical protein
MSVIEVNISFFFPTIIVSLLKFNHINNLTPKYRIEAPISVALWPPLGQGGTPSICGKAQNHFLSDAII